MPRVEQLSSRMTLLDFRAYSSPLSSGWWRTRKPDSVGAALERQRLL